jgi:hypothetical protein
MGARFHRDAVSILLVGPAVVEAFALELLASAVLFGARPGAVGFVAAEPYAVLRCLLALLGALALLAILVQIDDVADGHKPFRCHPADAIA